MDGATGVEGKAWRPVKEFHCEERPAWLPLLQGAERLDVM